MLDKHCKIYIAGHRGMVGSAIHRRLQEKGYTHFVLRTSHELDLRRQSEVERFFEDERPDVVVLAAAKVGGIMANIGSPATFLYDNIMIQNNVIHSAYKYGVKRLLFLGSSCIYPRSSPQPMKEECLLTGALEPTNEGYAIAKITGIKLCEMYNRQYRTEYISVMPCNLYGFGDDFDPIRSHVVPAMIRKFHEAKSKGDPEVMIWGSGEARRELMFTDDMADACVFLLEEHPGGGFFNIGTGSDISIRELAEIVKDVVGYGGRIVYDRSKPDGMPQKLMDPSRLSEKGWSYKTSLKDGLIKTYQWYLDDHIYRYHRS